MDNSGLLTYNTFKPYNNVLAFTTTKETLNSSSHRYTGDDPYLFMDNRKHLAAILKIPQKQLIFPRQTHTNCIQELDRIPDSEIKDTDALATNKTGLCLCVQTADCVPILLYDPIEKVISAIHAGWRGTVKRIVEKAVVSMNNRYGSLPENIVGIIGPSISQDIYEVGTEVVEKIRETVNDPQSALYLHSSGNYHLNLWDANFQIMLECGLKPTNVEISGECSHKNPDKYFSARRDGINTGRMVTGIMLLG